MNISQHTPEHLVCTGFDDNLTYQYADEYPWGMVIVSADAQKQYGFSIKSDSINGDFNVREALYPRILGPVKSENDDTFQSTVHVISTDEIQREPKAIMNSIYDPADDENGTLSTSISIALPVSRQGKSPSITALDIAMKASNELLPLIYTRIYDDYELSKSKSQFSRFGSAALQLVGIDAVSKAERVKDLNYRNKSLLLAKELSGFACAGIARTLLTREQLDRLYNQVQIAS